MTTEAPTASTPSTPILVYTGVQCDPALLAKHPHVRTAFGIWNDVVNELRTAAFELRRIGESRQAEALLSDAMNMGRRARLHLRYMAQRVDSGELEP